MLAGENAKSFPLPRSCETPIIDLSVSNRLSGPRLVPSCALVPRISRIVIFTPMSSAAVRLTPQLSAGDLRTLLRGFLRSRWVVSGIL